MRHKTGVLVVILLSATLTIMAGSIIAPIQNLIRDGLNVQPSSVGFIITTHGLFMAVFSPLMGSLIDRKGVRWVYIITLICYGLSGGAGSVIQSFPALLVSRALLGVSLAGVFTAINVLILNLFEKSDRDKVMGWRGSAQSIGGIAWPLAGGFLGALSWHYPFTIYLIAIPIGIAAIFAIPKDTSAVEKTGRSKQTDSAFQLIGKVTILPRIMLMTFSGSVLLYAIVIFLPQLLEKFGISSSIIISLFIASMTTTAAIISFFYGRIRKKLSYKALMVIGTALWTLAFTFFFFSARPLIAAIGASIFGLSQGIVMPTVMAWIGDIVPVEYRGRISSYMGTTGFIGQFAAPYIFAPVLIWGDLRSVFLFGVVIAGLWLVFNAVYFSRGK